MPKPLPPTYSDIAEELVESVLRDVDDGWRHGCNVTEVFYRDADETYWEVKYRRSADDEHCELRDGGARFQEVYPVERVVVITEYRPIERD